MNRSQQAVTLGAAALASGLMALVLAGRPAQAGGPWYVAGGGNDAASCLSPGEACATINGAIGKAEAGDTILVAAGVYTSSTGAEVVLLDESVTVSGGWDPTFTSQSGQDTIQGQTAVDGQMSRRGITVAEGITATVEGLTLQQGYEQNVLNNGSLTLEASVVRWAVTGQITNRLITGGVANLGVITITESSLTGNSSVGLANAGPAAMLRDVTISGNTSTGVNNYGGAVWVERSTISNNNSIGILTQVSATVTISGTTISGHTTAGVNVSGSGGAVINNSTISGSNTTGVSALVGQTVISGSTLRNNAAGDIVAGGGSVSVKNSIVGTCSGSVNSAGHNLVMNTADCTYASAAGDLLNVDAGPWTGLSGAPGVWALPPDSPAIDAGPAGGCTDHLGNALQTDQRGEPRFGGCDIGAYELQPIELASKTADGPTINRGGTQRFTIVLPNPGGDALSQVWLTDTLPVGLTVAPGTLEASSGSAGVEAQTITWTGAIAAGTQVTVTYEALAEGAAPLGPAVNDAQITSGKAHIVRSAVVEVVNNWLFLPVVVRPQPGIQGRVTLNGAPAAGQTLELRFYNGSSWSTAATTTTDGNGRYLFIGQNSLLPGQRYYVLYRNPTQIQGRLWLWGTRTLTEYAAGNTVLLGEFDIADVVLTTPENEGIVTLPTTFQWVRRPATPSDSYEFDLFDPSDNDPYAYTPLLGYVNGYTLTGLPSGFELYTWYVWDVWVYAPDGGFGISREARWVGFVDAGYAAGTGGEQAEGAMIAIEIGGAREDEAVWRRP